MWKVMEICCLEEVDWRGRGGYFDAYDYRDVMQNHLAQLLALGVMEQPYPLKLMTSAEKGARALWLVRCLIVEM